MRRLRLALGLGLISVLLASALPGRADHRSGNYHWPRPSNPFTLDLVNSMTEGWNDQVRWVANDWAGSSVLDLNLTAQSSELPDRTLCDPIAGKIRECNAPHPDVRWLGRATVWADSGGHIQKATAQMNDVWWSTPLFDHEWAKRHVLCQEVGHTLGLNHQYSEPSCMDDRNGLYEWTYVRPGPHDYEQLEAIYAHSDGGSSQDPDPPPPPRKCKHKKHDRPKKCKKRHDGSDLYTTQRSWGEDGLTVTQYTIFAKSATLRALSALT